MRHRLPLLAVALIALTAASSCGPAPDLHALKVIDIVSGYYDAGLKDSKNYLVPSVTFRLENSGAVGITGLELNVGYWRDGADGEWDSTLVQRIGNDTIPAGGKSDPVTVRCPVGYTLDGARADFFANTVFRDVTAKIFGHRGGTIVPLGEVKLERQILPHLTGPVGRP
jgi:hypothetical protein